jgi:sugar transferase EpsL
MAKRVFDFTAGLILLILMTPVMIIIALLVCINIGSPVVFRQERPGSGGRPFKLLKFRTMSELVDEEGIMLPDEQRLTKLGQILRKYSLDELPQLINVVRGDLSFVGPRPLLMQYLERYTPEQARRHEVKPGITGWAQVNGRNAISWEEKFKLDVWYVDNVSLWLDLKILWLTVLKVLRADGISGEGSATMSEFMGNDK